MKKLLTIIVLPLLLNSCDKQDATPLILNQGKHLNKLHNNNIGKIAYMNDWIAFDDFKQKDFVSHVSLNSESDLSIRMFLDKTLTYYLSQLEPQLTTLELCNSGNFQLSFFVDDKKIYQNNIPTGAGSCEYKNSAMVYGIPLINKRNPDHWGRFLWLKFMKKGGGQQALVGDSHQLKIEVRPYIEHDQLKVGEIIAQGKVDLIMVQKQVKEKHIAIQAIADTNKWKISTDDYDKSKVRTLNERIAQNYFKNITSITVIKNGELLIEEYFNGANRNSLHDMRSVSKTMASTVMGIAIDEGFIKDENQTLNEFYDLKKYQNYNDKKDKVTIKSLLTMSSSFRGDDMNSDSIGHEDNMYPTKNWVKFALDLPSDNQEKLKNQWQYFTAGAVLLGDILNNSVPNGLEKYAENKLLKPLNINHYKWQYTPTGTPNMAGSFQMSALDNARWGQLYLDNGNYDGKQILSQSWVTKSLTKHIALPNLENEYYSYLLWNKTYHSNDKSHESYYASGNGGNKIMLFKDINVVIVITATAYNQAYAHYQSDEIIEKYLLPALL